MMHTMERAPIERSAGPRPNAPSNAEEWPRSRDELLEIICCPATGAVSCECVTSLVAAIDIFETGRSRERRVV